MTIQLTKMEQDQIKKVRPSDIALAAGTKPLTKCKALQHRREGNILRLAGE